MRTLSTLRGTILGLVALAALTAGLAACGGSDDAASAADANANADAARIRLERCLRENGVDVPSAPGERRLLRADETKVRAAMQTCGKYAREAFGNVTPEQREKFRDAFTKFAACMRQHGVDLPDPVSVRGQGSSSGPPAGARVRIDRSSPMVQAAQKACQDKLPQGSRGGLQLAGPGGPR